MKQKYYRITAIIIAIICLGLAAAYWITPDAYQTNFLELNTESENICVYADETGKLSLSWPTVKVGKADCYLLSIKSDQSDSDSSQEPQEPMRIFDTSTELDGISLPFQASIQAIGIGKNLLGISRELSGQPCEIAISAESPPKCPELTVTPEIGNLFLSWKSTDSKSSTADFYEISVQNRVNSGTLDSDAQVIITAEANKPNTFEITFGENGAWDLPDEKQPLQFSIRAGIQETGCTFYGPMSDPCIIKRDDLTGEALSLTAQKIDIRQYLLQWPQTLASYYEIQEWSENPDINNTDSTETGGEWKTLKRVNAGETLQYKTGRLNSGSYHQYQIVAFDKDHEVSASAQTEFYADISTLYNTIWPITDLKLREQPDENETILETIPAGTTLCVLDEQDHWFQVRFQDHYGYIDSRFCMINLPEYLGDYCNYQITNSDESIFQIHGYSISQITGQVIPGFEQVKLQDSSYLAPYLYPSAQKLLNAAKSAMNDGYRLKIYEAFRPHQATRFLYDTTASQLDSLVSEHPKITTDTITMTQSSLQNAIPEIPAIPDIPDISSRSNQRSKKKNQESSEPSSNNSNNNSVDSAKSETPETKPEIQDENHENPPETSSKNTGTGTNTNNSTDTRTLREIMTDNGRYALNHFLAKSISSHNRGIALDLTLESLDTGEELSMQTPVHDLSWYASTEQNQDNSNLLASYMTAIGLKSLSSEWWHFQDDATRTAIGLDTYLEEGVNIGGWTRDDTGWRYRDVSGTFRRNTEVSIGNTHYRLDGNGYTIN